MSHFEFFFFFLSTAVSRVYTCVWCLNKEYRRQRKEEKKREGEKEKSSRRTMSFSLLLSKTFNYHSHILSFSHYFVVVCSLIPHCGITHLYFFSLRFFSSSSLVIFLAFYLLLIDDWFNRCFASSSSSSPCGSTHVLFKFLFTFDFKQR